MSKHTKGPWSGGLENINAPDGTLIASVHYQGVFGSIPKEEGRANSLVLAAAPEMLAALKKSERMLRRALDDAKMSGTLHAAVAMESALEEVCAAIAKAEGKE